MLKRFFTLPLTYIFLLGLFLRFYHLSALPTGFHVDEVKVGWNAYSLWKTGHDDWLHAFPLHYDTFGDQRPTGFFYATVPSLAIFGLTEFAVRFTPALFGSLAIIAVFFLVRLITHNPKLSTLSAFFLAVSPWHITLSRASSEGIIATTLTLFGLYYLIVCFSHRKIKPAVLAFILLGLSDFFYHTSRMLVPLFVVITAVYYWRSLLKPKLFIPVLVLLVLLSSETVGLMLTPEARSRLSQVSIFTDFSIRDERDRLPFEEGDNHVLLARVFHNKLALYTTALFDQYAEYFSGSFFFTYGVAKPVRYQTVLRGPVLYIEMVFILAGLVLLTKKRISFLPLLLLLLAPLPAAITTEDAPNLSRALTMSPFLSILAGYGFYYLFTTYRKVAYFLSLLFVLDFVYFAHQYVVHNPRRDAITIMRSSGATELMDQISKSYNSYDQIILTNRPDPLYPWYAFSNHLDPADFNSKLASQKSIAWQYGKVVFSQSRCPTQQLIDNQLKNTLAVDAEGCTPNSRAKLVGKIVRPSGGITYTLWTL